MDYDNLDPQPTAAEFCTVPVKKGGKPCGVEIKTMSYKGTGMCGDICRKRSGKIIMGEEPTEAKVGINPTGEC